MKWSSCTVLISAFPSFLRGNRHWLHFSKFLNLYDLTRLNRGSYRYNLVFSILSFILLRDVGVLQLLSRAAPCKPPPEENHMSLRPWISANEVSSKIPLALLVSHYVYVLLNFLFLLQGRSSLTLYMEISAHVEAVAILFRRVHAEDLPFYFREPLRKKVFHRVRCSAFLHPVEVDFIASRIYVRSPHSPREPEGTTWSASFFVSSSFFFNCFLERESSQKVLGFFGRPVRTCPYLILLFTLGLLSRNLCINRDFSSSSIFFWVQLILTCGVPLLLCLATFRRHPFSCFLASGSGLFKSCSCAVKDVCPPP